MVVSIATVASPAQGTSYYERDGYCAKDDPDHRAAELGLEGLATASTGRVAHARPGNWTHGPRWQPADGGGNVPA